METQTQPPVPEAKPEMKRYLVTFKPPLKKKYKIDAQDEKMAELWAEEQMKVWKKVTKYTITLMAEKAGPPPETAEEKEERLEKEKTERRSGKKRYD